MAAVPAKDKIDRQYLLRGMPAPRFPAEGHPGRKLLFRSLFFYEFSSTKEFQAFAMPDPGRCLACFDACKTRNKH